MYSMKINNNESNKSQDDNNAILKRIKILYF